MIRKTVGGEVKQYPINTEIVTGVNCGMPAGSSPIIVGFYIKNEGDSDMFVKVNNGSKALLKPTEIYSFEGLSEVNSCIVLTDNATVRWGGLI